MRMNKRHLLGLIAALPLAWLSACGGGGDGGDGNDASVRLINASPAYASLDLHIDDEDSASAVHFGSGSDYADVSSGDGVKTVLTTEGSTIELTRQEKDWGSGDRYTLVAYGWEGGLHAVHITDDEDEADDGKTKVGVMNAAVDGGGLDVYLTDSGATLEASTPIASNGALGELSAFSSITSGTYRLRVTGFASKTDVRLDVPAVTLNSKEVLSIILAPGSGGVLMHAIGAVQGGAVTPYLNTMARARLVAAVADSGTVTTNAGSTPLGTEVRSATIRDYTLVNAGVQTFHTTVNGVATTAPDVTATLAAGADVTVVVTGNSAADAQVKVIADDNRLPASTTKYKLRMVHAAPSLSDENLSLTIDAGAVVNDLPFASNSAYQELNAATSTLEISTPVQGVISTLSEQNLLARGVYTVFMFDYTDGPKAVLRKER